MHEKNIYRPGLDRIEQNISIKKNVVQSHREEKTVWIWTDFLSFFFANRSHASGSPAWQWKRYTPQQRYSIEFVLWFYWFLNLTPCIFPRSRCAFHFKFDPNSAGPSPFTIPISFYAGNCTILRTWKCWLLLRSMYESVCLALNLEFMTWHLLWPWQPQQRCQC